MGKGTTGFFLPQNFVLGINGIFGPQILCFQKIYLGKVCKKKIENLEIFQNFEIRSKIVL